MNYILFKSNGAKSNAVLGVIRILYQLNMQILKFTHNNQIISLDDLEGTEDEYKSIHKWLTDPDILQFYEGRDKKFSYDDIESKYGKKIEIETVYPSMIKVDDEFIGYLQYYIIPKEGEWRYEHFEIDYEPNMYAMDVLIGEKEYWGQGIGSVLLENLVTYIFEQKNASRIYIDPRVANKRAVKAYEKAGFKKVKILKEHEFFEGKKRDSWLMEYLNN